MNVDRAAAICVRLARVSERIAGQGWAASQIRRIEDAVAALEGLL